MLNLIHIILLINNIDNDAGVCVCSVKVAEKSDDQVVLTSGLNRAVITAKPFRIDFYQDGVLTVSANAKGLMRFEHTRKRATA